DRHRRDRGETSHPVRAERLDRVHVSCGDEFARLVPGRADQTTPAACGFVLPRTPRVGNDVGPGQNRVAGAGLRLAIHLEQDTANVRVPDPRRRVGVPGERRSPWTPARLVLRPIRTDRRIVRLLRLPGDDPVLDVDLPRARAGAVDAVRGTD